MMDSDIGQGEHVSATRTTYAPADGAWSGDVGASVMTSAAEISAERLDGDAERPTVESAAWLKQDDYWKRTTYIAVTGRQTAAAPHTRPLPRPRRFRRPSHIRSMLVLALMLALIVLIPVGVVVAQREASARIKLPTSIPAIPGFSQPTVAPTHAPTTTPVKPTATPKKK
jgi:hypothetical protein